MRFPWISLLLGGAAFAVHLVPGAVGLLEYDRGRIAAGELWRLLTAHFTHCSWSHLLWDLLAFVALGAVCEAASRARLLACLGLSAMLIPLSLGSWLPDLERYRGLSGIDSALFVLAGLGVIQARLPGPARPRILGASGLLLLFVAKAAYELATGETLFVRLDLTSMAPVPLAHIVGAVAGTIAACLRWRRPAVTSAPPLVEPAQVDAFADASWRSPPHRRRPGKPAVRARVRRLLRTPAASRKPTSRGTTPARRRADFP